MLRYLFSRTIRVLLLHIDACLNLRWDIAKLNGASRSSCVNLKLFYSTLSCAFNNYHVPFIIYFLLMCFKSILVYRLYSLSIDTEFLIS
jgi:hypothetical protein